MTLTNTNAPQARRIAPLRQRVLPEWTDYNSHLNVTWITHLFDLGTDNLLDSLGIGEEYARRENHSTFALEAHLRYLGEARAGDTVEVHSRLLAVDTKRIHYHHRLTDQSDQRALATLEQLSIHVDLSAGRATPWPESVLRRLQDMAVGTEGLTLCGSIAVRESL